MTNEEILRKAIEKAVTNGADIAEFSIPDDEVYEILTKDNDCYGIIFSHDFAKAFWGSDLAIENGQPMYFTRDLPVDDWEYHLCKMVLEQEPLQYLAKFL